jgi:hypothetical protein
MAVYGRIRGSNGRWAISETRTWDSEKWVRFEGVLPLVMGSEDSNGVLYWFDSGLEDKGEEDNEVGLGL